MSAKKNVIITGAGGMIGPMLAERLLSDGYNLILTDIVEPKVPKGGNSENVKAFKGDICDQAFVKQLLDAAAPLHAIFIFHGIMSAGSEANFDLVSKQTWRPICRFPHGPDGTPTLMRKPANPVHEGQRRERAKPPACAAEAA